MINKLIDELLDISIITGWIGGFRKIIYIEPINRWHFIGLIYGVFGAVDIIVVNA